MFVGWVIYLWVFGLGLGCLLVAVVLGVSEQGGLLGFSFWLVVYAALSELSCGFLALVCAGWLFVGSLDFWVWRFSCLFGLLVFWAGFDCFDLVDGLSIEVVLIVLLVG